TFVAAAVSGDDTARLVSAQTRQSAVWEFPISAVAPGQVKGWGSYAIGVTWALRRRGVAAPALIGYVDSCVPFGAGVSSSAALEAAFARAGQDLRGATPAPPLDRALLAEACVDAENSIAGAPTGGMDQAAALRSAKGCALVVDSRTGDVEQVPFDLAAWGLELLVIDTRAAHTHADGEYGARRATCVAAAQELGVALLADIAPADLPAAIVRLGGPAALAARRVRHVVTEIERTRQFIAALRENRPDALGPLMNASHESLRRDYEVSAPGLDLAVAAARVAGAMGARMTGGGFGGSAIALVEAGQADQVAGAVHSAFAQAGWAAPVFLRAAAAAPARRVA
ncbi:MAG: galactokinase, partial [Bifidobacteriaceae bacterium]|nr:galactokinase [Bifidobacteriaceae bacterium]